MHSTALMTVGDAQLEVTRLGVGPPLLFLHGQDGLLFSGPFMNALAEAFEVVAPHLPGFGRSSRPKYVKSVRDLALVTSEFVETVGTPLPVVAASFGAWVALELALVAPAAVSELVLVAPVGIKMGGREDRDFADLWVAGFDELASILYADSPIAPDLDALSDDDLVMLAGCQESVARYCWAPYMHDPALRHWARRIQCPTSVVAGTADRFALLPDYYARVAGVIGSGASLHVMKGSGHRVEEEAPVELAALVRTLLVDPPLRRPAVAAGRG